VMLGKVKLMDGVGWTVDDGVDGTVGDVGGVVDEPAMGNALGSKEFSC
jgi:hypothetical protein